jgi:hypothetical protein
MARLTLRPNVTYQQVGDVVAQMAAHAKQGDKQAAEASIAELKDLISEDFEEVLIGPSEYLGVESKETPKADSVQLNFHFDRTVQQDGHRVRIVNVVVPDFEDKLGQVIRAGKIDSLKVGSDVHKAILDLDAVAKEAFGFITICGCAG